MGPPCLHVDVVVSLQHLLVLLVRKREAKGKEYLSLCCRLGIKHVAEREAKLVIFRLVLHAGAPTVPLSEPAVWMLNPDAGLVSLREELSLPVQVVERNLKPGTRRSSFDAKVEPRPVAILVLASVAVWCRPSVHLYRGSHGRTCASSICRRTGGGNGQYVSNNDCCFLDNNAQVLHCLSNTMDWTLNCRECDTPTNFHGF